MEITLTFQPATKADWRQWLGQNHASASEVWAVLYKKSTGKQTVTLQDIVDEALCFGWIDGLEKRLDDERYVLRLTPRKNKEQWSDINKRRYAELLAAGLVTESGKEAYQA
jgi:uncharacterized protein YdeI (YjbR/CyaY-like superfamily)